MDSKQQNHIICPKCGKIGTLRRKEKGKNRLICYHYDKKKYQKNESPDSPCYLGTLDPELQIRILNSCGKINKNTFEPEKDSKKINEILENFEITEGKWKEFDFDKKKTETLFNDIIQAIASLTNEYKKYNQYVEVPRRLIWDIHCPNCLTKYIIASHFMGIKQSNIKLDVIQSGRKRSYKPDRND